MLFRNPRPSIGWILKARNNRFANALTRNHGKAIKRDAACAVAAMRGYHKLASGKNAPLNAFGKHLLEVGCGLGFRMREFEKYGWTTTGLEPSENACTYTRALALHVLHKDLDHTLGGLFDCVLIEDVIDEITDPKKFAGAVRKMLKPKGIVCVAISDIKDETIAHNKLYRFGEDSLRRLFMKNGFVEPLVENEEGLRMWFKLKIKR